MKQDAVGGASNGVSVVADELLPVPLSEAVLITLHPEDKITCWYPVEGSLSVWQKADLTDPEVSISFDAEDGRVVIGMVSWRDMPRSITTMASSAWRNHWFWPLG